MIATLRFPGAITWRNVRREKVKEYDLAFASFYVEMEDGRPVAREKKPELGLESLLEDVLRWCMQQLEQLQDTPIAPPVFVP